MSEDYLNQFLEYRVPQHLLDFFRKQAEQKIEVEGWGKQGRNVAVKVDNFVHCWTTEEAFKQLLINEKVWFRHRGLYFGDSQGAGADFTVRVDGQDVTVGLRSVAPESLYRWKSVAYPNDRFIDEQDKIADYHVVCNHKDGHAKFFGIISKERLLSSLQVSPKMYSRKNQETFRIIPLQKFKFANLRELIDKMERV
jgi:hypothetical protein